ncbi:MAG: ABC transporter permease [Clostridia bacterium]|nr:ABC transporter permease [Clostridia bacterium]NCC42934.1 ABC transporter permease [Clostridia bacterium]
MSKLLYAGFWRLMKNKFFWISTAFMAFMGFYFPYMYYIRMKQDGLLSIIDNAFFIYVLLIGIISSVLCSLFTGKEYSDGTIRNKIAIGYSRVTIYFSNLILCILASLFMCFAFMITVLATGLPLLGAFSIGVPEVIGLTLSSLVLCICLVSIYTLITMLNKNKTTSAITCILGFFLLLFIGVYLSSRLGEPETFEEYIYTDNAGTINEEEVPNPNYLRGTKRDIYIFINDFLPGGQIIQFSGMTAAHPEMLALYSMIITVVTTGFGVILFRKKDLN